MKKLVLLPLLLVTMACTTHQVAEVNISGRTVAVWKPAGAAPAGGYPLVLFSHGFGGCDTQSVFLMQALAGAGYLVLAPNHQDARCGSAWKNRWQSGKFPSGILSIRPEAPFWKDEAWSDAIYKDRAADIEAVLDAVLQAKSFQGVPIDPGRIGMAGHSLGGYTALGLAGAWTSWKDNRIKAVLALSPYSSPYVKKGDLGHMNVPVMYQGGTRDYGVTPSVRRFEGVYDLSSSPKYYVEFGGSGHFAWTELRKAYQPIIGAYSVAFFDRYLKGKASPDPLEPLIKKPLPKEVSFIEVHVE